MQEMVYKQRITDVDELREHILAACDELHQRVLMMQSGNGALAMCILYPSCISLHLQISGQVYSTGTHIS